MYIRPVTNAIPAESAPPADQHPGPAPGAHSRRSAGGNSRWKARSAAAAVPQEPTPTPTPGHRTTTRRQRRREAWPPDPRKDLAERIAQEKKWRQSTSQGVQFLALQYQATRCGQDDILAGNDDPNLPLVTCSTDHKTAYLLAPSIISGDQIQNATYGLDQHSGGYVVDLQFKSSAANTWADFTAAHVGTQTAFTLDSQVVSAPQIREAIPGAAPRSPETSPRARPANWPTC
ncbi:putative export membrane protein secD [Mycobacterium xenopi 3993]|nr:putative export membrane protein secD [Mycobacterium xenopi 3993]